RDDHVTTDPGSGVGCDGDPEQRDYGWWRARPYSWEQQPLAVECAASGRGWGSRLQRRVIAGIRRWWPDAVAAGRSEPGRHREYRGSQGAGGGRALRDRRREWRNPGHHQEGPARSVAVQRVDGVRPDRTDDRVPGERDT